MKVLKVKRNTVVKLFEKLGFKTASKWSEARLAAKINNLPKITDGVKIKNPKVKNALKKIMGAGKVVIEGPKKTKAEIAKEKAEDKSIKDSMKKKGKGKEKKGEKGVDQFGRRLGTQGARIDSALGKKGKTIKAIAKETKLLPARVATHVRDLLSRRLIKQDENGKYLLKK